MGIARLFQSLPHKPPSQLRLIHYPYNPTAGEAFGIGSHTDYECLTLLSSTAPGLEVLNSAGRWIDAPPLPGALVVNIGDMMEIWTNGEFVATSHRVRPVKEERYSVPCFSPSITTPRSSRLTASSRMSGRQRTG